MRRLALGFLGANLLCVVLAALSGAVAHLVGASLSPEVYELLIGDRLLPSSPIDSMFWGPIFIGAFVSWWFGFIAAPFVSAAMFFGPRRSLVRPMLWFSVVGIGALIVFFYYGYDPHRLQDVGADLLMVLLDRGYTILGLSFAALALSRWRGRERPEPQAPDGIYPRPQSDDRPPSYVSQDMNDAVVAYAPDKERYEIRLGSDLIGFATAHRQDGVVTMPHVEIVPAHRGKDYANQLVRGALDDIEAKGERVVARCPFVVAFLRRNAKYRALQA